MPILPEPSCMDLRRQKPLSRKVEDQDNKLYHVPPAGLVDRSADGFHALQKTQLSIEPIGYRIRYTTDNTEGCCEMPLGLVQLVPVMLWQLQLLRVEAANQLPGLGRCARS